MPIFSPQPRIFFQPLSTQAAIDGGWKLEKACSVRRQPIDRLVHLNAGQLQVLLPSVFKLFPVVLVMEVSVL